MSKKELSFSMKEFEIKEARDSLETAINELIRWEYSPAEIVKLLNQWITNQYVNKVRRETLKFRMYGDDEIEDCDFHNFDQLLAMRETLSEYWKKNAPSKAEAKKAQKEAEQLANQQAKLIAKAKKGNKK